MSVTPLKTRAADRAWGSKIRETRDEAVETYGGALK
jgi:hypothetical protein